jgi:hypothetical protein
MKMALSEQEDLTRPDCTNNNSSDGTANIEKDEAQSDENRVV